MIHLETQCRCGLITHIRKSRLRSRDALLFGYTKTLVIALGVFPWQSCRGCLIGLRSSDTYQRGVTNDTRWNASVHLVVFARLCIAGLPLAKRYRYGTKNLGASNKVLWRVTTNTPRRKGRPICKSVEESKVLLIGEY